MAKKICILGAGLVARPAVTYLLNIPDVHVALADIDIKKANELINGHPRGRAMEVDPGGTVLPRIIEENDVVISLLPAHLHAGVAQICLEKNKHLVTASYVSPEMASLHEKAVEQGLLFLNETGLDPGIDHMSAMKIIHSVREKGGYIRTFRSICGGLPSPESADNPLKYRFSWSPMGVLKALKNSAQYLQQGKQVKIMNEDLMSATVPDKIDEYGPIEVYPNRDSLKYIELYGITRAENVMRGTIRNPGWADIIITLQDLGYLQESKSEGSSGTYKELTESLAAAAGFKDYWDFISDRKKSAADALDWLGLTADSPLSDTGLPPIEHLRSAMEKRMAYRPGDRDMLILQHEFEAVYPSSPSESIRSLLIAYGDPDGDSAMSKTVSLPAAIAALMLIEGRISARGVQIPVHKDIYEPVLNELERLGITFQERWENI